MQAIRMGLLKSLTLFREKMFMQIDELNCVLTKIDDLLVISINTLQDLRTKSNEVLRKFKTRVKSVDSPEPVFLPNRARIPRIMDYTGHNYARH